MSTRQGQQSEMKQRIDNLADQDCAKKGVILLLQGGDAMSVWMELQMHLLQHNDINVLPLSNCQELVPAIESLRSQCNSATSHCDQGDEQVLREDMIRNCVLGHPLSNHKFAKLMSCVKGLSHLAAQMKTEEGRETICNALGKEDGLRLVAYFQDGPKPL
ncbi:hypothetical protein E4U30_007034 [Claviceps sp. LM220 group G6]|nr:hypothetical protein E4U30_007034 [Claviceps sp. LM220 group G6]